MASFGATPALADVLIPAEHYTPIRVDIGLIGTYLPAGIGGGGFGGVVEPKFLLTDNIALGLQFQGAFSFGANVGVDQAQINVGAVSATLAKGEYLFTHNGNVRPFVGLGLGFYDIVNQSVGSGSSSATVVQKAARTFGIEPQLGVDLGAVRLAVSYNAMLGTAVEVDETVNGMASTRNLSENYLMFELGFRIGGRFHPRGRRGVDVPPPPPGAIGPGPAPGPY